MTPFARSLEAHANLRAIRKAVGALHRAKTPTTVRPELVKGDHISYVIPGPVNGADRRIWGFKTPEERDAFVSNYADKGARPA